MTRNLQFPELLHTELRAALTAYEEHIQLGDVLGLDRLLRLHPGDASQERHPHKEDGKPEDDGEEDTHGTQ